jgi:hypothetical protein
VSAELSLRSRERTSTPSRAPLARHLWRAGRPGAAQGCTARRVLPRGAGRARIVHASRPERPERRTLSSSYRSMSMRRKAPSAMASYRSGMLVQRERRRMVELTSRTLCAVTVGARELDGGDLSLAGPTGQRECR